MMMPEISVYIRIVVLLILLPVLQSCHNRTAPAVTAMTSGELPVSNEADATVQEIDSITIKGNVYQVSHWSSGRLCLVLASGDTIVDDAASEFAFEDFDRDGFQDIRLDYMTNVPNINDVLLFDAKTDMFRMIDDLKRYPTATALVGTPYYYSYHRSGCADMNWDSDLFYIDNYKTYRIGNIEGRQCGDARVKDGIYISTVSGEEETLLETMPIDTIDSYEDYKWGFIKDYWTRHYKKFAGKGRTADISTAR